MGILKDLENVCNDIDKDVEKIAATLEKDLDKAKQAVSNGIDKLKSFLVKDFDDAELALLKGLQSAKLKKYASEISALQQLAKSGIASADKQSIVNDIESIIGKADSTAAGAVLSNLVTPTMQQAWPSFRSFRAITLGCDGEIDLIVGVSASASAGIYLPSPFDANKARVLIDFLASSGAEEGGDLGLTLGAWVDKPKGVGGGFIAMTVTGDLFAGAGVITVFTLALDPKFAGIVIDLEAGEEAELSIDCGYTLALPVPSGTMIPKS